MAARAWEAPTPATAAPPPGTFEALTGGLRVSAGSGGRILVIGYTPAENKQVAQWAENAVVRIADLTGASVPFSRERPLTIQLLKETGDSGGTNTATARMLDAGRRLLLAEFARLPAAVAHDAIGACFLAASRPEPAGAPPPPGWIVCGVARNLYAPRRAEDADAVLEVWEEGRSETLIAFLNRMHALGAALPTNEQDRARCGFALGWFVSGAARAACWARLLDTAGGGAAPDPGAWAACVPAGGTTAAQIEEAWDRRMLRQRRVVARPGHTSAAAARRFRAALLIYPGVYGMPAADDPYRPVEWRALIALRTASWMQGFCERKTNSLRMAAVGRGDEAMQVADAYCAVLAGLRNGKSEQRLQRLIEAASAAEAAWVNRQFRVGNGET